MKPEHFQKMREEYETLKLKKLSEKEVYIIMKTKYDELCSEIQKPIVNSEIQKPIEDIAVVNIIKPEETINTVDNRRKSKTIEEYNW